MDRTKDLLGIFDSEEVENDSDVGGIGKVKELFAVFVICFTLDFRKKIQLKAFRK